MDVIIYGSADNPKLKNRGFAFLEFDSHKSASTAKRKLSSGRVKVWGCDIIVDWADPQEEPDEETMSKVSILLLSWGWVWVRKKVNQLMLKQMTKTQVANLLSVGAVC